MGVTVIFQHMMQLVYCCHVMVFEFDWSCQLSGSGSNSMNPQNLPGCF